MLDEEVGYLWLYRFDQGSAKTLDAVNDLHSQDERPCVDLRNNPGGLLDECVAIGDMLLPKGLVLYSEESTATVWNTLPMRNTGYLWRIGK